MDDEIEGAVDLREFNFSDIDELRSVVISIVGKDKAFKFLVVTIEQRYMILQDAKRTDVDAVPEIFLGLQMAVSK